MNKINKNFKWVCSNCKCIVEPENVTFEETHDIRSGGCGHDVFILRVGKNMHTEDIITISEFKLVVDNYLKIGRIENK